MEQQKQMEFFVKNNGIFSNEDVKYIKLLLDKIDNENHPALKKDYHKIFNTCRLIKRILLVSAIVCALITTSLIAVTAMDIDHFSHSLSRENYEILYGDDPTYRSYEHWKHEMISLQKDGYIPCYAYGTIMLICLVLSFIISPSKYAFRVFKEEFESKS